MRILAKGATHKECNKRVGELIERGWEPVSEPNEVVYMNYTYWVVVLHKEDAPHNPRNRRNGWQ